MIQESFSFVYCLFLSLSAFELKLDTRNRNLNVPHCRNKASNNNLARNKTEVLMHLAGFMMTTAGN